MERRIIHGYDCDGVITVGINPPNNAVIITGRSYEEMPETLKYLESRGIHNQIFFNSRPFFKKTRKSSGEHKARTIKTLFGMGIEVKRFFEDDPIQILEINKACPWVEVVHINHELTEKENVRHEF